MLAEAHAIPQDYDEHLGLAFLQPFVAPYVRDHREKGELLGQGAGFQRVCTLLFCSDHRPAHAVPTYAHPGGGGSGFRSNQAGKNHHRHGPALCNNRLGPNALDAVGHALEKALHEIQVVSAYEWHMPIDVGQLAIPQVVLDLLELTPEHLIYTDVSGWRNVVETESKIFSNVILIRQDISAFSLLTMSQACVGCCRAGSFSTLVNQ